MEWRRDGYLISTDPNRLDRDLVYDFLRTAYWSPNVPRAVVERSIEHSLVFGLFEVGTSSGRVAGKAGAADTTDFSELPSVPAKEMTANLGPTSPEGGEEVGYSGAQVGFARVVTDRAVFAYLADVFVLEQHRGRGLGVWLIERVLSHPDLQGLRRIVLGTKDAHALYERFGFEPAKADILMTRDRSPGELYGTS